MKSSSDRELLFLMQQDREKALSILIDRYSAVLLRHINRRIKSLTDSQDILQNIFLSLWNNRQGIEIEDSIYPYLYQSARYKIIDWTVKNDKQLERQALLLQRPVELELPAEETIIAKELQDYLNRVVEQMPPTMQSVFKLSREESMTIREIASYLNISEQTVKNNITMALNRLRGRLKHEHYILIAGSLLTYLR